jgi:hypothetical protein
LAPDERVAVFHSSGTTEQRPSRHFHSGESLALYESSLTAAFQNNAWQHLPRQLAHLLFLTPSPGLTPHSSLNHMFAVLDKRFGHAEENFLGELGPVGEWVLPKNISQQLRAFSDPVLILGTAFSFVHLLDALGMESLSLPQGSALFETGGYKGRSRSIPKAELHASLGRVFNIPPDRIICEYGMSELSSQAYSRGTPFVFPPWARTSLLSPETGRQVACGETGLLRIYDLANVGSVMALQTEDLAMAAAEGPGFHLLGRAELAEPRGCSLMPA